MSAMSVLPQNSYVELSDGVCSWSLWELELDDVTQVGSHDEIAILMRRDDDRVRESDRQTDRQQVHVLHMHALRLCEDTGRQRPALQEQTRPQKAPTLLTPWSWISMLQNARRTFLLLKSPRLWMSSWCPS